VLISPPNVAKRQPAVSVLESQEQQAAAGGHSSTGRELEGPQQTESSRYFPALSTKQTLVFACSLGFCLANMGEWARSGPGVER
jgi:hypothetical protein